MPEDPQIDKEATEVSTSSHKSWSRLVSLARVDLSSLEWRLFLPVVLVYPTWLYVMVKEDAWEEVFSFYVMSLTMVFGSLIAGSTPMGGGVVAFPVVVLYLKLQPEEGRDFSLMIQSVGMTSASFLIIYAKRHLCHFWIILWFLISSLVP